MRRRRMTVFRSPYCGSISVRQHGRVARSQFRLLVHEKLLIPADGFGGIAGVADRVRQDAAGRKGQRVLLTECPLVIEKQFLCQWHGDGWFSLHMW